jgi:choline dehydrogenase-like flavoprotein
MPTGAIINVSGATRVPAQLTAEICIVGSGCGGGTAARVLAEAGHDVVVLEEGGDFPGERLTQRDGEMYDQLYMDRGGRATYDLAISVLQGRVLGGGGVINASDVVPIPEGVYHHWVRKFGLSDFAPEKMAPYAQRALTDLSATRIQERQLNRANKLLRDGTEALGMRGEAMLTNRVGCAGLGTCLIGCPIDAKRNPRTVAIPKALEAGARFYTRSRVVSIDDAGHELKRITVRKLDPLGYHERGTFEVRAKVVVLAANAVATSQLLLRSSIGNQHVGRHLSLQPQLPVTAIFDDEVRAFRGIPQAYAVTEFEREDDPVHGLWGFRVEAIMGTPGMVGSLLPYAGTRGKEQMTLYSRIAASLVLVPDEPSGTVALTKSGRPEILYDQSDGHRARVREGAKVAARIYLAAGAREVLVPSAPPVTIRTEADLNELDGLTLRPASAPFISAHQQGGVRFATAPADGAADPDGQVYGTRGVYVFDSSGFPSSSSSHTMMPIMTVSHYLSAKLSSRL